MKIRNRQNFGFSGLKPLFPGQMLTGWTVSIAAGMINVTLCPTLITPFNMPSQIPRPAVQDIKYDFILVRMKMVLLLVVCDVASQDVG
jgi:hypothetical protein